MNSTNWKEKIQSLRAQIPTALLKLTFDNTVKDVYDLARKKFEKAGDHDEFRDYDQDYEKSRTSIELLVHIFVEAGISAPTQTAQSTVMAIKEQEKLDRDKGVSWQIG